MPGGDAVGLFGPDVASVVLDVGLVEAPPVDIDERCATLHAYLDALLRKADDALDERASRSTLGLCGGRSVEDDHVAAMRIMEVVDEPVREHAVGEARFATGRRPCAVERRFHGGGRDPVRVDHPGLDRQHDRDSADDRDDPVDLVGRLQSNKARQATRAFAAIHSVDSLELLGRIDRIAAEESLAPALLLQVNVTGEETKAGFPLSWFQDQLERPGELAAAVIGMAAARVTGLMTIGPTGADSSDARAAFATLRRLRDALEQQIGRRLPELSMGMTADAEAAVAEGATLVRVGTAMFGPRPG